ncbi:hypothetical protein MF672_019415 [Actinomadura sp. ATCC 31491]|uniref:Uncharacterized protein n=1 Tax=Actinomadura luzonensis TaxID=2805427 RepID=A0ABT0FUD7_9ACTN|nr:hypothetical protein [Actinomadura luzonensis]MCK2215948.1 hypothetical protein [Actinomadura luzonensis]
MLLMHGWAIGLSALWLSHGETLLWSLLRRLAVRLRAVLAPPAVPARPGAAPARFAPPVAPRPAPTGHGVSRRGPPAAASAHAA